MPITDTPILSMLRTRMQWHQARQKVLAENVANADTPSFKPRDLREPKFDRPLSPPGAVVLARTDPSHLGAANGSGASTFANERSSINETRPSGNSVVLEHEMLKVAGNQMDYQAAASLYGRSLGLLKTALGKR
jgi:flagellar basal-body rod protein FlgB